MNRESLSEILVDILLRYGPQDFRSLLSLVESDDRFGYLSLRHSNMEQLLRECLTYYSDNEDQKFKLTFGYKWHPTKIATEIQKVNLEISRSTPWISRGIGEEYVYGIFSPKQMSEALQSGNNWYPIKVGRTRRAISTRLRELQTGSFQDLQLGLVIRTDCSVQLETFLHRKLQDRKLCENSSQSEWFLTSLVELDQLTSLEAEENQSVDVIFQNAS